MKYSDALLQESELSPDDVISEALEKQKQLFDKGIYKTIDQILIDEGRLSEANRELIWLEFCMQHLRDLELFGNLSPQSLWVLAQCVQQQIIPPNTVFIQEGEKGDSFCIILSGKVRVFRALDDKRKVSLNTLGPDDCFGEMALLTGNPRAASVETLEPTLLLVIHKQDFDKLLTRHPALYTSFLKVISGWLDKSNVGWVDATLNEQAYQQLLSDKSKASQYELVGKSKAVSKLRDQIRHMASDESPLIIVGEPGTEKLSVAALLHKESGREGTPFLTVNAKTVSLHGVDSSPPQDAVHLEIAQKSALFGHEKGNPSSAPSRRLGVLEAASSGTVVIEEISSLSAGVQEELADFLASGEFRVANGQRTAHSDALVIATDGNAPETLLQEGKLSPRLGTYLAGRCIVVPPIRKRKRDLALITAYLIQRAGRQSGKSIQGMEREAYSRIMAYDWPGNIEELDVVIRRAVNLAQGKELTSEDVFIGIAPARGKLRFNLFQLGQVHSLFAHRAYPAALQAVSALCFLIIVYAGFFGSQQAAGNISLPLTWGIWEPTIIIVAFFAARIWCMACPIGAVNEFLSRHCSLQKRVPHFIRHYGLWLGAIGLGVIIWAEVVFHLPYSPMGTALLLSVLALLGVIFGLLFQRRSWCRYVCPLGYLLGIFSQCSIIEMRANNGLCNNECQDHRCYVDSDGKYGCPIFQAPFSLVSNLECILCGQCVKNCTHQAPRLNLRPPGYELIEVHKPSPVMNVFVPVILGCQILRGLQAQGGLWLVQGLDAGWLIAASLLVLFSVGAHFFIRLSGSLSLDTIRFPQMVKGGELFSYVLIPLIFAYELGFQLEALLTRSGSLLPLVGQRIGLDWNVGWFVHTQGEILFWQTLFMAAGLVFAFIVLNKLAQLHQAHAVTKVWRKRLPLLILASYYLWSFVA